MNRGDWRRRALINATVSAALRRDQEGQIDKEEFPGDMSMGHWDSGA